MAGPCDDIFLLLSCEVDKFHRITGNPDRKVGIFFFFRMFHGIQQLLFAKYIDIKMMCPLVEIAVQHLDQIADPLALTVSQCIRVDRLGIGNPVQRPLIRELGQGIQRGKKSVLLCPIARIRPR